MILWINIILDLIEKYNSIRPVWFHITLEDVLDDVDDLDNEEDILRLIKELEMRTREI